MSFQSDLVIQVLSLVAVFENVGGDVCGYKILSCKSSI